MPETDIATIRVNPVNDPTVKLFQEEALRLQHYAESRIITDDAGVRLATDDLSILSKLKKNIEEKRKEYVGPINEHVKAINDAFKMITGPLEAADATTRGQIMDFRHEQEEKAHKIEEANRLKMEAARLEAEASGTGEIKESIEITPAPPIPAKTVISDTGSATTAKIPKFEVTDKNLVPAEFLVVDMVALGKQVRAGRRDIPGVRIWLEDSLRINTR